MLQHFLYPLHPLLSMSRLGRASSWKTVACTGRSCVLSRGWTGHIGWNGICLRQWAIHGIFIHGIHASKIIQVSVYIGIIFIHPIDLYHSVIICSFIFPSAAAPGGSLPISWNPDVASVPRCCRLVSWWNCGLSEAQFQWNWKKYAWHFSYADFWNGPEHS